VEPINKAPLASSIDRIPPQNLEAEMALLGAILVDKDMMDVALEIVEPTDFYASLHEAIFLALGALHQRRMRLDKIALAEELKTRGMLDKVGGVAYLSTLMDTVPTASSTEYYARLVRRKAMLRGLILAGAQITAAGYEGESDEDGALVAAERALAAVTARGVEPAQMPEPGAVMDAIVERLIRREKIRVVESPWHSLNATVGGFTAGELVAIVAAAKVGKSGLAVTFAEHAAAQEGAFVFFATEMGDEAVERRRLAIRSGVSARKQRLGDLSDGDLSRVVTARNALRDKPLIVVGRKHRSLRAFWRVCRDARSKHGQLAGICVDHVGFTEEARAFDKSRTETQALDELYRGLLDLAEDFQCPVFAVVHPNREGAIERPSRATLHKIRGGGALENHAHTILCPWRADPINNPHEAEVIVVASRDGGEGALPFYYDGARATWFEMDGKDVVPLWFESRARRNAGQMPLVHPGAPDDAAEDVPEEGLSEYAASVFPDMNDRPITDAEVERLAFPSSRPTFDDYDDPKDLFPS
jgi:replicative DNA helicase